MEKKTAPFRAETGTDTIFHGMRSLLGCAAGATSLTLRRNKSITFSVPFNK